MAATLPPNPRVEEEGGKVKVVQRRTTREHSVRGSETLIVFAGLLITVRTPQICLNPAPTRIRPYI